MESWAYDNTIELKEGEVRPLSTQVFVRVRPLVGSEVARNDDLITLNCSDDNTSVVMDLVERGRAKSKKFKGFTNVITPDTNNEAAYEFMLKDLCSQVTQGKTVCAFAYGHTGSGKTHTMFGYGEERGMYRIAASKLSKAIQEIHNDGDDLFIDVRFVELYGKKIQDLLGDCEVFNREDDKGVVLRGPTVVDDKGNVRITPVCSIPCKSEEEVFKAVDNALKHRHTGSSNVHEQSSRSHAILEMEIVSRKLLMARTALIDAESELHPVGKALADEVIRISTSVYKVEEEEASKDYDERTGVFKWVRVDGMGAGDAIPRSELQDTLERSKQEKEEAISRAKDAINDIIASGPPCLSGTFVVVDLAGNEFAGGVGKQATETRDINTSLLCLKEVFRGLHIGQKHVTFRRHKLTLLLRKHLVGKDSSAIMIANISPSLAMSGMTSNTLAYGSLIATA